METSKTICYDVAMNTSDNTQFTANDVEKLTALSRLSLTDSEKETFAKEIGGILSYVGQIQEVSAEAENTDRTNTDHYPHKNIMREDISDKSAGKNKISIPSDLINSAPNHTEEYIKVKKILGGSQ